MERKNLLLLIAAVLLVAGPHPLLQASNALDADASQEYSGVGVADALLTTTAQELMQAYDLLDMLKKRSHELNQTAYAGEGGQSALPRTLDAIRNRMIKQQLLDVLSATPFSDPEKHVADCKAAITALESYLQVLQEEAGEKLPALEEITPATSASKDTQALSAYGITAEPSAKVAPAMPTATPPSTPTTPIAAPTTPPAPTLPITPPTLQPTPVTAPAAPTTAAAPKAEAPTAMPPALPLPSAK